MYGTSRLLHLLQTFTSTFPVDTLIPLGLTANAKILELRYKKLKSDHVEMHLLIDCA